MPALSAAAMPSWEPALSVVATPAGPEKSRLSLQLLCTAGPEESRLFMRMQRQLGMERAGSFCSCYAKLVPKRPGLSVAATPAGPDELALSVADMISWH